MEISLAAPLLPILVIHIRSHVKTRQSQSYKFLKNAKNSNFEILQETLYVTHPLKVLDKMYKYEMDPTRTVGTTERTQDAGQTEGPTDGQTDGQTERNQYTPQQLRCVKGIIMFKHVQAVARQLQTPTHALCCDASGSWLPVVLNRRYITTWKKPWVGCLQLTCHCYPIIIMIRFSFRFGTMPE